MPAWSKTRTVPSRSTPRAETSTSVVSPPWAPAFIRSAPPIAPGMPRKKASPSSAASAAARATLTSGTAAPARTRCPASSVTAAKPRPSLTTTPGTPPSRRMTLEPRPSVVTGTAAGMRASA